MKLYYKHIKHGDYNLWVNWVRHNGYGLIPKLKINHNECGIFYKFDFKWYKLEAYMATQAISKFREEMED